MTTYTQKLKHRWNNWWEGRWTKRTYHDPHLPLTQDERDTYDTEYGIMKQDRDEWQRRATMYRERYESMRQILDAYADHKNWVAVQQGVHRRLWLFEQHGYELAEQWVKKNLETERL